MSKTLKAKKKPKNPSKERVYLRRPGAIFPESATDAIGQRLDAICERHGALKPEDVLADAIADKDSPLRPYIEWDRSKAAREHQLSQIRRIIGAIEVKIHRVEVPVRRFHSVIVTPKTDDAEAVRGYVPLERVQNNAGFQQQVLSDALTTIERFAVKYRGILDACGVTGDLDRVINRLKARAASVAA